MGDVVKPFDPKLYAENDKVAKEAVMAHLSRMYNCRENENQKMADLVFSAYAEVEIKHNWKGGNFPYKTVHIPKRKAKYMQEGKVYFFVLSEDLKKAIVVEDIYLLDKYVKIVPNKYVRYGEEFFDIPMEYCKIIDLRS